MWSRDMPRLQKNSRRRDSNLALEPCLQPCPFPLYSRRLRRTGRKGLSMGAPNITRDTVLWSLRMNSVRHHPASTARVPLKWSVHHARSPRTTDTCSERHLHLLNFFRPPDPQNWAFLLLDPSQTNSKEMSVRTREKERHIPRTAKKSKQLQLTSEAAMPSFPE